jgi:AraC-like DNA-binding protein
MVCVVSSKEQISPVKVFEPLKAPPAIFREHGRTLEADTCTPLEEAAQRGEVKLRAVARGAYPGTRIPNDHLAGVCSMGFWDGVGRQTWGLDWHRNEGVEFTFLEKGHMPFEVKGFEPSWLEPGSMAITRPWQPHRIGDPEVLPGRLHWLILDVQVRRPNQPWHLPDWIILSEGDKQELLQFLSHSERPVWRASQEVQQCFNRLGRLIEAGDFTRNLSRLAVHINEMLISILEMFREQPMVMDATLTTSQRTVDLFLQELAHNPQHLAYPWSVREMAKQCGLGVTYFVKYCRAITNNSPAQHIIYLRTQKAAELLRENPELPVHTIAEQCGFTNARYLATVFRKQFGCTPREYRDSER